MRAEIRSVMRAGGFTLIEVLVVLFLISGFYALFSVNLDARSRAANFAASVAQARLWSDAAEIDRQSGVLPPGVSTAPARTPFGGAYRVTASEHAAVVSFDVPFAVRGGGVFVARGDGGGTLHIAPSVFAPTSPLRDRAVLYEEAVK